MGTMGNILHVHLDDRKVRKEEKEDSFYRSLLGGRGIGYHYLLKHVAPQTDPLSQNNVLVLATGVMTGSKMPAACRFAAIAKSPLTGAAGESESAGFFGPELKMAGFDAVVFHGKAEGPVYLWITDGKAEIRDASAFAHSEAKQAEDAIRSELGSEKIRVAQTGPAGMNQVLFANITNNLGHFCGRNGMGAVMGSKNIRAVAALGTRKIPLADPEFIKKTAGHYAQTFRDNPLGKNLYTYGTTAFAKIMSDSGCLPVNNFRQGRIENADAISGDAYNKLLLKKRKGCYACPIRCKRQIALEDAKYGIDSRYGGPEYETMAALGSNLNITDLKAIAKGNEICNRYCMDTISAGMTIAFACECFENGIITKQDTGGLELRFGDADLMIKLLEMTARREGFGDQLAVGSARLAIKWGVADKPCSLSVKGQEIAMHDPRVKVGVGIGYATSTYGADHMIAGHDPYFAQQQSYSLQSVKPIGIYSAMHPTKITTTKVRNYTQLENLWRVMDALGLCLFGYAPRGVMPIETMVDSVNAVTGWNTSLHELMKAGERGTMMAKAFNCREGFTIKDDLLPKRLFDAKPDGADSGCRIAAGQSTDRVRRSYGPPRTCWSHSRSPRRLLPGGRASRSPAP